MFVVFEDFERENKFLCCLVALVNVYMIFFYSCFRGVYFLSHSCLWLYPFIELLPWGYSQAELADNRIDWYHCQNHVREHLHVIWFSESCFKTLFFSKTQFIQLFINKQTKSSLPADTIACPVLVIVRFFCNDWVTKYFLSL